MRFEIDTDIIEKEGFTMSEFCFLMVGYFNGNFSMETFHSLCDKGYLRYEILVDGFPKKCKLTENGIEEFQGLVLKSATRSNDNPDDRYIKMANAMREIYPSGTKPGVGDPWKASAKILATRLRALEKKYSIQLDYDDVVDATERYVQSFKGDFTYMQLLKYFILKKDTTTNAESSRLLEYLEDPALGTSDGDWTTELL